MLHLPPLCSFCLKNRNSRSLFQIFLSFPLPFSNFSFSCQPGIFSCKRWNNCSNTSWCFVIRLCASFPIFCFQKWFSCSRHGRHFAKSVAAQAVLCVVSGFISGISVSCRYRYRTHFFIFETAVEFARPSHQCCSCILNIEVFDVS